jgi:2-C-methyl-D-erythritol 4-phosphate cytidylyltransferase/2-C-methyl-D-erythritol 4-phosphate cytidylyltransferase/2-C-methyl-D-erythritol 2,4-cyclodiphosphate synthase
MGGLKKEYQILPGAFDGEKKPLTVLGAAVSAFAAIPEIGSIVIAIAPNSPEEEARRALPSALFLADALPPVHFVQGGPTRRASVHLALEFLKAHSPSQVLIHDGARPWISGRLIRQVIDAVRSHGAALPLLPLSETPKEIDGSGFVVRHLRRAAIACAQTPQGFRFPDILAAHEKAAEKEKAGFEYTDDAEVWGEFAGKLASVPGERANKKITFPEDLEGAVE